MSRRAAVVALSPQERSTLQSWARARRQPQRLVQRAHIVLLAAEGIENQRIARQLGISRPTVQLWRQRFLALRTGGLEHDAPRAGRLPRIPGRQVAAIVEATLRSRPQRHSLEHAQHGARPRGQRRQCRSHLAAA